LSPLSRPLRIAIVNDYEVVVAGVAAMLDEYRDRVEIVELDSELPVISAVDIVLLDTFALTDRGPGLADLVHPGGPKVVVFTWSAHPRSIARALDQGAVGYLSKRLSTADLVKALEDIHAGHVVTSEPVEPEPGYGEGDWPGRACGLSPREAEVIALIAQGLTNQEVGQALYLSINSVKTYVATAYRKIGVQRRSQAVLWAIERDFVAEPGRSFPTAES
jgi:NarL family two-component system response regulator LiaR